MTFRFKTFKSYQQLEHSDCGLTCIRMIVRHFGRKVSNEYLQSIVDMSRLGLSLRDIVDALKKLGFEVIPLSLSMENVSDMPLPAILYWEKKHFVVLYKMSKNHYWIADPATGKRKLTYAEFKEYWLSHNERGVTILMEPTNTFYTLEIPKSQSIRRFRNLFFRNLIENKKYFSGILILTIIGLLIDLASPLLFQETIDNGIVTKNISLIWLLVLGQLMLFLGNSVGNGITNFIMVKLGLSLNFKMMNEYLRKIISMPLSIFGVKVNSDLIQKIDDQNRIKNFMVSLPAIILFTIVSMIAFSAMLVYYNWLIFIIFISLTIIGLGWTSIFISKRRELDYQGMAASAKNRNIVYELINGIQEIRINEAQHAKVEEWSEEQTKLCKVSLKTEKISSVQNIGNGLLARCKDIGISGLCATLVAQDSMTIGVMMTISYIVGRLSYPFNNILSFINMFQDASVSYQRIEDIMNRPSDENNRDKCQNVKICQLDLTNVSFKYPGSSSPFVLKNISITIPPKSITAIVGESGCGKSTLLKIILGLYSPAEGNVKIGDQVLCDSNNSGWLHNCGVVMQDGRIFSGTLLSNIAMSDSRPDLDRVEKVLALSNLRDFIYQLPMGLYTNIGVAGIELSGGQQQRLLIARALYKDPSILILDEATSTLDAKNEAEIITNIIENFKDRTIIISAHRLSTIRNADQILFMKDGKVEEIGNHSKLMSLRGGYYDLICNQL